MNTLKVICVGTGYFSQFHYEAWSRLPNVDIVGINNRSIDKAEEFSKRYNIPHFGTHLSDLIEQTRPNLIDIITPPETHLSAVKIAAKYGVDVICQKPFGEHIDQAKEMVALAKASGIQLIIHENFRFMPWYRKAKAVLDSGKLGEVLDAEFKLRPGDGQGADAYLSRQPYFQKMPKFLVHETAIHLVDTFRYLFGEPNSVYADLRRCNAVITGEDAGLILFKFPNNLRVMFNGNRLLDHAAENTRRTLGELEITGTSGELRLNGLGELWFRSFGQQERERIPFEWQDQNFGGDCVFNTIKHIADHYLQGRPIENQGWEYIRNIEIENAIYHSAANGHQVSVNRP